MKYHYEPSENWDRSTWKVYRCDHPLYNRCTLYTGINDEGDEVGLAAVQMHFNEENKSIWWGSLDPWIASDIFKNVRFQEYFQMYAGVADEHGLYFTVPVRKLMWALRMKPLKREFWEDSFDSQNLQSV